MIFFCHIYIYIYCKASCCCWIKCSSCFSCQITQITKVWALWPEYRLKRLWLFVRFFFFIIIMLLLMVVRLFLYSLVLECYFIFRLSSALSVLIIFIFPPCSLSFFFYFGFASIHPNFTWTFYHKSTKEAAKTCELWDNVWHGYNKLLTVCLSVSFLTALVCGR